MGNKELFLEYMKDVGITDRDSRYLALKKSLNYTNKNILYMNDLEIRELLIVDFNISNSHSLNNYRSAYYNYFNWYIKKHNDDKVFSNIFDDSLLLSMKALKKFMIQNVIYYTKEDINNLVENSGDNKIYVEAIIRSSYEGIQSAIDMAKLTVNNIDYNKKKITLNDYTINISDRLLYCLEEVRHMDTWYQINGKKRNMELPADNSIFGFVPNKNTTTEIENRILSTRLLISKTTNNLGIDLTSVYISGFIGYLLDKIGMDNFIDYYSDKKHDITQLDGYAKEYGLKYRGKNLTHMLQPYMLKFKYSK